MAEYTPPGEPVELPDGPLYGYTVHFPDGRDLTGTMAANDKADAELKVRAWLLTDPGVKWIAQDRGDPGRIDIETVDDHLAPE
jgi:hypothetical protein